MYKSFFKRLIDLIFSAIGLVFLFPIIIPVILILRFTGEKEVFYFQERIGCKE